MRRVSLDFVKPGMKVARPVFNSEGKMLLGRDIILTDRFISRLSDLGITAVYIMDDILGEIEDIPEVVSEQSHLKSVKLTKQMFKDLEMKRNLNIGAVQKQVDNLVDEILSNRNVLINCYDIKCYDDYTYNHSVNVCILSILTGIKMQFDHNRLRELGVGALLHDTGKTQVEKEILNKPGKLTDDEFGRVKCHTEFGFDILRGIKDISLLSAHVAFQHHERWDGSGYPRGLQKEEIHDYSRIVAVADVFDALTTDRPYRKARPIAEVLDYIGTLSSTYFDERAVNALITNIARFPIGSVVMLSSGEIGQVVKYDSSQFAVVRVIWNERLRRLRLPYEINLAERNDLGIIRVLSDEEIDILINISI